MYNDIDQLPPHVKNAMDEDAQKVWMDVYNYCGCSTKAWSAVEKGLRTFEGIATSEKIDDQKELISTKAVIEASQDYINEGAPIYWHHKSFQIGTIYSIKETNLSDGTPAIKIKGCIYQNSDLSNNAWNAIKSGELDALSIGFYTKSLEKECNDQMCYTRIKSLEWHDTSIVKTPSNPVSFILDANYNIKGDQMTEEEIKTKNSEEELIPDTETKACSKKKEGEGDDAKDEDKKNESESDMVDEPVTPEDEESKPDAEEKTKSSFDEVNSKLDEIFNFMKEVKEKQSAQDKIISELKEKSKEEIKSDELATKNSEEEITIKSGEAPIPDGSIGDSMNSTVYELPRDGRLKTAKELESIISKL